jgi:PEP-CTERM motif
MKRISSALILGGFLLAAQLSTAATINVNNPSFEAGPAPTQDCSFFGGPGCLFSTNGVLDWTVSGSNTGLVRPFAPPNTNFFFDATPDGVNYAYSNGGFIRQTVGELVAGGLTYTLRVDLGIRRDFPVLGELQLLIGDLNGSPDVYVGTGPVVEAGRWGTFTVTYVATNADIGKMMTINLVSPGAQASFDNVRFENNATQTSGPGGPPSGVPEPSTYALFGAGLVALRFWARR